MEYDVSRTRTARPDNEGGQRPDLVPGRSNNPITGDYNKWFDVTAFSRPAAGYLGNLGRGTLRGPNYTNLDFSLIKQIPLSRAGENRRLDIRLELFNALNHTNFNLPAIARTRVFTSTGIREDAGRITTAQPAREIQLGMKLFF
jgi:hypothetical protein